jgi:hypothetical protein
MEISIEISPRIDEHGTGSVFHVETDDVNGNDLTVRLQALRPVTRQECVDALYRATTRLLMATMVIAGESERLPEQIRELEDEDERLADEMDKAEEAEQAGVSCAYDCDYECECSGRGCCAPEGTQCTDACACVAELKARARRETEQARTAWETARRELDAARARLAEVLGASIRYVDTFHGDKTHDAVTAPVTERLCACGCGQQVTSQRPEAKYATGACRVRAHRAR